MCRKLFSSEGYEMITLNPGSIKDLGVGGSMLVSDQLRTYPSPNPKLTLNCYQLIVVGLREGWVGSQLLRNLHTSYLRVFCLGVTVTL